MSLPPGFLDELRTRLSLVQVVGRKVSWDTRKSNQGRGDMWAPCPFHQEKTASFHVDDRKGFYYCFGCHEKGDAINFVMATENVSFIEAVKMLAEESGLAMPQDDPQARQTADRRTRLTEVLEEAAAFFALRLRSGAGAEACAYLERRGLDRAAQGRWGLGFAPAGWQGLMDHLTGKGIATDLIVAAGLARTSDRGRAPYDVFRNRVMFPIRDARGRLIAFGGRAMDPDDTAKYLNSPETELFDKGRSLYNHEAARKSANQEKPFVVAEGYMDVIALSEAGFTASVAPLGTAITEEQLRLLWSLHPEPIVALDGDAAGQRAAMRLLDLALPMLEAGRSLRFCLLPDGQDPDDLLRAKGRQALANLLANAVPMVDLLWQREVARHPVDSPERRAALDRALREAVGRISDQAIRRHYGAAIRDRLWHLYNPRRTGRGRAARTPVVNAAPATRNSALASGGATVEHHLREAVVLALLLRYPILLERFEEALVRTEFDLPHHARIAEAILANAGAPAEAVRDRVAASLGPETLENVLSARHLTVVPAMRGNDPASAGLCLAEELAKLAARRGAERELIEAIEDFDAGADESLTYRLTSAIQEMHRASNVAGSADTEWEVAPNGVRLDRDQVSAARSLFDSLLGPSGPGKAGK
ncbi:DNA primase [Palleronia aestuarii]|uniref:DNA primase n=1 Tax=Palleronia aestuarii TaxID=568105 RepID=A0A2W7N205_9RHOB|nr:DNA primase [Palleronia aestuarii]PZX13723.1 DNA primase [Palleronia aestuarii]